MSKVGEKQIPVPQEVQTEIKDGAVFVKGTAGELTIALPNGLEIAKSEGGLDVKRKREDKRTRSLHGLYRTLVGNAVLGVQKPWEKRLEIVGTGYNVKLQGEDLILKVGYSHPVTFQKMEGVSYKVEGNNKIIVQGVDKQLVGQVAHQIKIVKKPDAYKGKGIKYEGEQLKIKPGKKAKAAGTA